MSIVDVEISAKNPQNHALVFIIKPNLNFQHNRKQAEYFSSHCSGKHAGLWNIISVCYANFLLFSIASPLFFRISTTVTTVAIAACSNTTHNQKKTTEVSPQQIMKSLKAF